MNTLVSILQALKVSLLFLIFGLIPFVLVVIAIVSLISMGFGFDFKVLYANEGVDTGSVLGNLGLLIVASFIFFVGLFKAIGDIAEAALLE